MEQPEEHRKGRRRAQKIRQQEQVEHAETLRGHPCDGQCRQHDQPARKPHQRGVTGPGHQPPHVDGDDAGRGADGGIGTAHHERQPQRDERQREPQRHFGQQHAEQRDRAFALDPQPDEGQTEQPHQPDSHEVADTADPEPAAQHRCVARGIDPLPRALIEQPGQRHRQKEREPRAQPAGVAQVQQMGRCLLQPGKGGRDAAAACQPKTSSSPSIGAITIICSLSV